MATYPSSSHRVTDRQKHQQAARLDIHHRLQRQHLEALGPVLIELDCIDLQTLTPDSAAFAIGRLDALLTTNASPAVKAAIGARRLEVIGALMAAATSRDGVRLAAEVGGPAFREAFERQVAFGPLRDTIESSRAVARHADTRLQPTADVENIDRARLLANRLVADDGGFDAVALHLFDVAEIADARTSSRQMAHSLSLLAESGEAQMALLSIEAPPPQSNAARLVRRTLGLPGDAPLTAAHARRAALAALLCELRQSDVGSCFATQVAIRIHDTEPATCLRDMAQMMAEGRITRRLPDGTQATARIETGMSEAALRDHGMTLNRDDPCALIGSSIGGTLPHSVTLDAAPGLRSAMAAIGIAEDDLEDAMAKALESFKTTRLFTSRQNLKAVLEATEAIRDPDLRAKVIQTVQPRIMYDGDVVRNVLQAAMSHADPTSTPPAAEQAEVLALLDRALEAPTFDIEPVEIIEALILRRLGLDEDAIERAEDCDALRAELAAHPDIRSAKVLTRPADAALLDELDELRIETDAIDWTRIRPLKSMRRDAFAAFLAESQNPLLRGWEYTLTAVAERASKNAMQGLQKIAMDVLEEEAHDVVIRIIARRGAVDTGVDVQGMRDIAERLMASYRKVFTAGTSVGYDASARADVSQDGHSARGAWCLYDIQGIDDPDQWIRIEDADAYGRLGQGMMMLAWKQTFGQERDPAIAAMSRHIADELCERLISEDFANWLARRSATKYGNRSIDPWRLPQGGASGNEVLDGRPPVAFTVQAPINATDLVGRLGAYLKTLWNDPATGLKARAERHGDMAAVTVNCRTVHTLSLVPGTAAFARLLDDPRNFMAALDDHLKVERVKWKDALDGTLLRSRADVAEQTRGLLGNDATDAIVDEIWNGIRANPTMRLFYDLATRVQARRNKGRVSDIEATRARHVVEHLVPPVPAAQLAHKLGKVAKALAVPPHRMAAVVGTAQAALRRIDATRASMIDIRAEMAASMHAHGLDADEVRQDQVSAALQEPAGLIFADTNWGNAAHRMKFAMVVHPFTGEPQVWQLADDCSSGRPVDPARFVHQAWEVVT